MKKFLIFSGIGIELGGLMMVAVMVGGGLDKRFGTNGLIFLAMALIFLAAWLIQIVVLLKRIQRALPETEKESSPDRPSSS